MPKLARRSLIVAGAVFVFAFATLLAVGFALERGALHGPLLRLVSAQANRPVRVGELDIELFDGRPRIVARDVVVGNPPWMPQGELARIGVLTLSFAPTLRHPLRVHGIELRTAVLRLRRDANGKANWQRREPRGRGGTGGGLPLLRHLVLENVTVHLRDAPRHLDFDGEVATLAPGAGGELRLRARGTLNERPLRASLQGQPLARVRGDAPWRFSFDEQSSGARVTGTGSVLEPFNFARIDIDFEARGEDLRDLYYLVGVRLPDTGPFTAKGRLLRRDRRIEFRDLQGQSGESDISGTYVSRSGGERPEYTADFQSRRLRTADLGPRAAGRQKPADGPPRLLPDWPIPLQGLRLRDGKVTYRAAELIAGPLTLPRLSTRLQIEGGVLTVEHIGAATSGAGRLSGELHFDARSDRPSARVALRLENLAFGELFRGKDSAPPLEAPLSGAIEMQGEGRSLHELAAHANGQLGLALAEGTMRKSLAAALGFDFRAVGLRLSGSQESVPLRCAVARFKASDGKLATEVFVLDTEAAVVGGEGGVDLDSELLDLRFRGRPKQMQLRLRTALELKGRLAAPAFRVEEGRTSAQAGAAVALGALVTPLAAAVAFVDPGRAKDQDCVALLARE